MPSIGNVNLTVICAAELKATRQRPLSLLDELIAVTKGTDTKPLPAITQVVCVFSIVDGVVKAGLASVAIVTDPQRNCRAINCNCY